MGNAIIGLFLATLLLLSFHFCYWVLLSWCRCLFWGETFFIKPLVIFMWLLPRLLIASPLLFIPSPPFFNLVFTNFTHKMQNDVQQPSGDFCSCCVHYVFFLEKPHSKTNGPISREPRGCSHASLLPSLPPDATFTCSICGFVATTCSGAIADGQDQNESHLPQFY